MYNLIDDYLGIDAASSFMQGYWIWSKIVENLAVVGYDTNNMILAAYDWRLSYWNLEERDGYFSRLKASIEEMKYGLSFVPPFFLSAYTKLGFLGNGITRKQSSLHIQWVVRCGNLLL